MANRDRNAVQSGLDDILGNVIRTDQRRSGRGPHAEEAVESTPKSDTATTSPNAQVAPSASPAAEEAGTPPVTVPASGPSRSRQEEPARSPSDAMTIRQDDIMTNGHVTDDASEPASPPAASGSPTKATPPAKRRAQKASAPPAVLSSAPTAEAAASEGEPLIANRVEAAQDLALTPTMTVTLRIPHGLNDWLDEYVHGSWPQKIKKQELVIEALRLLYARRGRAKEELVETELLGEE